MPATDDCLSNYVRNYLLCCIFPDKTYNPAVFEENHVRYLVCFGAFHVVKVLPKLVLFKTLMLFAAVLYELIISDGDLLRLFPGGLFGFFITATANIILLIGARFRRYALIIPYLFTYVLFAFLLVLLLFVNFLETANTKDTLSVRAMLRNAALLFVLIFEVYGILLTWRLFVYVCDFTMDVRIKAKRRSRRMKENCKYIDQDVAGPIVLRISSDTDIELGVRA